MVTSLFLKLQKLIPHFRLESVDVVGERAALDPELVSGSLCQVDPTGSVHPAHKILLLHIRGDCDQSIATSICSASIIIFHLHFLEARQYNQCV